MSKLLAYVHTESNPPEFKEKKSVVLEFEFNRQPVLVGSRYTGGGYSKDASVTVGVHVSHNDAVQMLKQLAAATGKEVAS